MRLQLSVVLSLFLVAPANADGVDLRPLAPFIKGKTLYLERMPNPECVLVNTSLARDLGYANTDNLPQRIVNQFGYWLGENSEGPTKIRGTATYYHEGGSGETGDGRVAWIGEIAAGADSVPLDAALKGVGPVEGFSDAIADESIRGYQDLHEAFLSYVHSELNHSYGIATTRDLAIIRFRDPRTGTWRYVTVRVGEQRRLAHPYYYADHPFDEFFRKVASPDIARALQLPDGSRINGKEMKLWFRKLTEGIADLVAHFDAFELASDSPVIGNITMRGGMVDLLSNIYTRGRPDDLSIFKGSYKRGELTAVYQKLLNTMGRVFRAKFNVRADDLPRNLFQNRYNERLIQSLLDIAGIESLPGQLSSKVRNRLLLWYERAASIQTEVPATAYGRPYHEAAFSVAESLRLSLGTVNRAGRIQSLVVIPPMVGTELEAESRALADELDGLIRQILNELNPGPEDLRRWRIRAARYPSFLSREKQIHEAFEALKSQEDRLTPDLISEATKRFHPRFAGLPDYLDCSEKLRPAK